MAGERTHNVVIVGGNFGGVNLAHYLLRQTFPALLKLDSSITYRVILITPNKHFFYKIASPRALINNTLIPEEKIFHSISDAFKQYDAASFTFVRGKATKVEAQQKSVTVSESDGSQKEIQYDSLVISTGTTSASPLWTLHDDDEKTRAALNSLHEALPKAETVLIAGAGPVGVETAGEIASAYPDAKVTLITPGDRILPHVKPNIAAKAARALQEIGVTVRLSTGLADASASSDARPIRLSNGSSESPDVFINATGPREVNTNWLPSTWLDAEGRVSTKDSYFRVKGDNAEHVYVIGDVVAGTNKTAIELDGMVPVVASSLGGDISKELGFSQSTSSRGFLSALNPFSKPSVLAQKEYKPMKDTILIPIGPNNGVGQVFGWGMPTLMVKKGKAENFLMEMVEPLVTGKKWA